MKLLFAIALSLPVFNLDAFSCEIKGTPPVLETIQLKTILTGLDKPVKFVTLTDVQGTPRFVVEQGGRIKVFLGNSTTSRSILDLSQVVSDPNTNPEGGLLGLAFHPEFQKNRRFFVNYTFGSRLKSRISEFRMDEKYSVDKSSEKVILELAQPYSNHNGGEVAFGPDGYLYIGFGDGGSGGDPQGNSQNLKVLLGKILRLDVNNGSPYSIPSDNPFINTPDARPEIYAYGLRNPWRFSFDRVTGDLWAGDVGQNRIEEIDLIKRGGNYGWRTMEANECFKPSIGCNQTNLILPITQYDRSFGVSVTGGFVYRGRSIPALIGTYIYGDFQSGNIWGLRYDGSKVIEQNLLLQSGFNISAFGEDESGDIVVVDYSGKISKIVPMTQNSPSSFPTKISDTKCFTSTSPLTPVPALIPFEVNSPLWSDGLYKERYAFFPQGTQVKAYKDSPWEFPEGSVFIKHFYVPQKHSEEITNKIVETRFLTLTDDGLKGYSYKWNEAQTEAFYQAGSTRETMTIHDQGEDHDFSYYYPSSSDCGRCHTDSKGVILGFSTPQLNKFLSDGTHQLDRFREHAQIDTSELAQDPRDLPALLDYRDHSKSINERVRGFMDVQCSTCHNLQNVTGSARLNLNYSTGLASTGLCNKRPNSGSLGMTNPNLLAPGHPSKSIAYLRLTSLDPSLRMPAIATSRIDPDAIKLMHDWISGLQGCD